MSFKMETIATEVQKVLGLKIGIELTMAFGFVSLLLIMAVFAQSLTVDTANKGGNWLPTSDNMPKRNYEIFSLAYTVVWIGIFGVVVVYQLYEQFDEYSYMKLCVSLALPFLLQPFVFPLGSEKNHPLHMRYSFKATVWIAIFSFIGNYWYTHYFYNVLQAKYTFPAHRLNDVPIALFFATHFYFVTYHTFSNCILRKIETRYTAGAEYFVCCALV